MNFEIISHQGAGPVRFGMDPPEIRKAINRPFETFKRSEEQVYPCDSFDDDILAYYDSHGKAEAFEFFEPAPVTWNGQELFGMGFEQIVGQLRTLDPNIELDSSGFTSLALGIGAYAPDCEDEPSAPPESIIVFTKGYYD